MKSSSGDHRVRVTKMMIRRAFTELLQKKPIQGITVQELCKLAGINRGTFYAHYQDVYALLEQIERGMMDDFRQALDQPDGQARDARGSVVDICARIFQCIKDNSDICVVMLGDYGDKDFLGKLLSIGKETCLNAYSRYFTDAKPREIEYFYAFVSSGCIGLLRLWVQEGMAASAMEIAQMAERIMLSGIGFFDQKA